MGQQAQHTHTLPDGTVVGYSLTDRPGGYRVRFVGPQGNRVERATGCRAKGLARSEANTIIDEAYRPSLPDEPKKSSWELVLLDLARTPDLRPESVRAYQTAVGAVRKVLPDVASPADITTELAHRFKRSFLSGTYSCGKASDARRYNRAPTSCATYLRSLRSLWSKHFKPLGHVKENPWLDVPYPNTPRGKRVRVPAEEVVTEFSLWLGRKHAGWDLPPLFVLVKMLSGCRTLDLCKAKTRDLGGDKLTLSAEATKTREARTIPLSAALADELRRRAGPEWLWERSVVESKVYRPCPRTHGAVAYNPSTWRWTIQNLFREFNAGRPPESRLRPHDLRARTMTVVWSLTRNLDAVARAMGVDRQTAQHYADAEKALGESDVLRQAAGSLGPRLGPGPPE